MFLDAKWDGGRPHRQRLHVRALSQAGGELLGPHSCELVVLDIEHPEGHHLWEHMCQVLSSRITDAVIVQAAGKQRSGQGLEVQAQGDLHPAPFHTGAN